MDLMAWLNVFGQIATASGIIVAIWAIYQNSKIDRKQTNVQIFLAYTERFREVMATFPDGAFQSRYELSNALPPVSKELTAAALNYLNMVSEEFYLRQRNYLDQEIWSIWEAEIQRALCLPLIRREWKSLEAEFVSFPEFVHYVHECQGSIANAASSHKKRAF